MSKVSRSIYQKLAEENKRLKNDIKSLVDMNTMSDKSEAYTKWRNHFEEELEFLKIMKKVANELINKTVKQT